MPGSHHNVFYYYRGPTAKVVRPAEEARYHRQVEDNSTKALINVLELGGPPLVRSFLARFAPPLADRWHNDARPELHLQVGQAPVPDGVRLLLGLTPEQEEETDLTPSGEVDGGSRIDAAIVVPGAGMLAIEVKVAGALDPEQMKRHAQRWRIEATPLRATWADIWRWARTECKGATAIAGFLLKQLTDYLEILGLAPWGGFREEDFEYFNSPSFEQHIIVRRRVIGAWIRISEALQPAECELLGEIRPGRSTPVDHGIWAQTNSGEQRANLDLQLNRWELQLNLVGWKKAQASRVLGWLCSPDNAVAGKRLRGFQIVLWRRPFPHWPREAAPERIAEMPASETGSALLRQRVREEQEDSGQRGLLACHIRRAYRPSEVISAGEEMAERLVTDVRRLLPVLAAINGRG